MTTQFIQQEPRILSDAMLKGGRLRCPKCGDSPLFLSYLKPVETCANCNEDISHQRADDLPAYLTIFIIGHIVLPLIVVCYKIWPGMWDWHVALQMGLWLPILTLSTLTTLPFVKGAVIGLQWALYMHGFGGQTDEDELDEGSFGQ